jgi:hypothetical protein
MFRRSRASILALVVISILALGPIAALIVVWSSDSTPVRVVVPADPDLDPSVTRVSATVLSLAPTTGDLRVRLAVQPADDLVEDGRLTQPMTVATNDLGGGTVRTFEAGQVLSPFETELAVTSGTITRYPYDRYDILLLVVVSTGPADEGMPEPVALDIRSTVADFVITGELRDEGRLGTDTLVAADLSAHRPATTTVYASWLMLLMWGLAFTGVLIAWAVVIWQVELPMWVFGYFVGVLFALPPLRDSLPGRPPPGTVFDFVSFYWSITLVGITLILLLVMWIRRARWEIRHRHRGPD